MSRSMAGRRRPLPLAIRVASAGLLAAIAFTGCNSATGSSQPAAATPTPTQPQAATATSAPTPTAAALQPPAAPTDLNEWIVLSGTSGAAPVYYKWTAPAGPISGYHLWIVGTYVESSPPPAVCGNPGWLTLPASATSYNLPSVEADAPTTYICAFNSAGMSPVVKFPVVDQAHAPTSGPLELPAAPTWLSSQLNPSDGTYPSEELGWTPPAASIRGYYLNIVFYEAGDLGTPVPEPCGPTWKKLPASATTYTIPAVETPPLVYICAFNDAGTSPTVMFPQPVRS